MFDGRVERLQVVSNDFVQRSVLGLSAAIDGAPRRVGCRPLCALPMQARRTQRDPIKSRGCGRGSQCWRRAPFYLFVASLPGSNDLRAHFFGHLHVRRKSGPA